MKPVCPCCYREFDPPAVSAKVEDMNNLFSCNHCQSVLKWEDQSLKVVYESKRESSSPSDGVESVSTQVDENVFVEAGMKVDTEDVMDDNPIEVEVGVESNVEDVTDDSGEMGHLIEQPKQEKEILSEGEQVEEQQKTIHSEFLESSSKHHFMEEELDVELVEKQKGTNQGFVDVEEHGNAQATSEKGFLRYDLHIAGMDSIEIEQQVLSILEDPRFRWDAKEIVRSQKEGVLVIKNLNPIKAMCLVSNLLFLSVELSWKQYMALNAGTQERVKQTEE